MELARPPSQQRGRSRSFNSDNQGTDVDHVTMDSLNIDSRSEAGARYEPASAVQEMKTKLFEQEGKFIAEREKIKQKKKDHKRNVKHLFDKLKVLLEEKEKKINDEIDFEFDGSEKYVNSFIAMIVEDKLQLNVMGDHENVCSELEAKISRRDEVIASMKVPDLSLNTQAVQILTNYRFGGLDDIASDDDSADDDEQEARAVNTNVARSRLSRNSSSDMRISTNLEQEPLVDADGDTPTPTNDPTSWMPQGEQHRLEVPRTREDQSPAQATDLSQNNEGTDTNSSQNDAQAQQQIDTPEQATHSDGSDIARTPSDHAVGSLSYDGADSRPLEGAVGGVNSSSVVPSAPVIEDTEGDPPSYWQAMGLEAPEVANQLPGYYDMEHAQTALPSNKLEPWHSFPTKRSNDKRTPMPCALVWNKDRIVIGDRANRILKFYNPSGMLIGQWLFRNEEIHDVAFLEEVRGDARYLVTCQRSGALHIISINANDEIKLVHSWNARGYNTVCRGPTGNTFVGGYVTSRSSVAGVDIFNFQGKPLTEYKLTPSNVHLEYPRKVLVHGHNVIVCDWKLNMVAVYLDDGQSVAEYRGTPQSPLCNPIDITLDHCGNIMIIDGEMSHIHVIDLDCNPLEIINVPKNFTGHKGAKLVAYDTSSHRLAITRSTGDIAIFTFKDGYDGLPQRRWGPQNMFGESPTTQPQQPINTLPLIEGMLPSTIEQFMTRGQRNRMRQYNL